MVAKGLAEGLQGEEGILGKDSRRWMRLFHDRYRQEVVA